MNISDLPADLVISKMTYLSFNDVISLCNTDKRLHKICTNSKYSTNWKLLIDQTYKGTEYYDNLDKTNLEYNYILYTNLIHYLHPYVQLKIYQRQGDQENIERTILKIRMLDRIEQANISNRVLDISNMDNNFKGIIMIPKPGSSSRKRGVEGLPVVSAKPENYEKLINLLGPKYNHYLVKYLK
jgi:hypothetical protein